MQPPAADPAKPPAKDPTKPPAKDPTKPPAKDPTKPPAKDPVLAPAPPVWRSGPIKRPTPAPDASTPTIQSPANNDVVAGLVKVTYTPVTGGFTRALIAVDGSLTGTTTSNPTQIDWDTTTLRDGPHTLQIVARSTAGERWSNPVLITVKRVDAGHGPVVPGEIILGSYAGDPLDKFRTRVTAQLKGLLQSTGAINDASERELNRVGIISLKVRAGTEVGAAQIAAGLAAVRFAIPNYQAEICAGTNLLPPNDYDYPQQGVHTTIDSLGAWTKATGNENQRIAFVDTGINPYRDLGARLVAGKNFLDDTKPATDDNDHGSFMATIACATGNNLVDLAGLNWHSKVIPVKVADQRGLTNSRRTAAGIIWAAAPRIGTDPLHETGGDAKFINVSVAGTREPACLTAIDYARTRGALVICSAGNKGMRRTDLIESPAIWVGSVDYDKTVPAFSESGPWLSLVAPGVKILSIMTKGSLDGIAPLSGTSVSASIVTGVASLVNDANPQLNVDLIKAAVLTTCKRLNVRDNVGYGLVNASPTQLLAGENKIYISANKTVMTVALEVTENESKAHIFSATAFKTPYTFLWDSTRVNTGYYTLTATATGADGKVAIATAKTYVYGKPGTRK
jgi:hypothetical protein